VNSVAVHVGDHLGEFATGKAEIRDAEGVKVLEDIVQSVVVKVA